MQLAPVHFPLDGIGRQADHRGEVGGQPAGQTRRQDQHRKRQCPDALEPALGGPCPFTELACLDGPQKGQICGIYDNPDGFCGAPGLCDACPVHGGVTTEDEMFILLGNFYLPGAGTPVAGDRLLLKTGSGRFVFKTKDAGVTAPSGDPTTDGASLAVSGVDAVGTTNAPSTHACSLALWRSYARTADAMSSPAGGKSPA